jgi:chromate transport protein ChrA
MIRNMVSTTIATILTVAAGTLMMYWPIVVMGCFLAVALIGMALDRKSTKPKAHAALHSNTAARQSQKQPILASEFLKAA